MGHKNTSIIIWSNAVVFYKAPSDDADDHDERTT